MRTIEHAVIPCAGVGSRLDGNAPKSLMEISGQTLLARTLRALEDVPRVFLIVGFQKEKVIQEALRHRGDLTFVSNEYFDRTNTLYSVKLASQLIRDDFLLVDGDVVFDPDAFKLLLGNFELCGGPAMSYSRRTTEDGVKISLATDQENGVCTRFHRGAGEFEWTGIARLNNRMLDGESLFVYETMERHLPMPAYPIDSMDIDTPADLKVARAIYG
ncbi:NTP transferase domain-containing protein [Burkholderia diffusa]|uniref:phosphocholine cytidylyltransferase family protein n=1 Tax=Burkholderia diffusa TaxID=488732 RepID=UPI0009C0C032|nr:NTP transferase domain-containing protein [Burkholderia diffusa]